jgi:hypothetical protein
MKLKVFCNGTITIIQQGKSMFPTRGGGNTYLPVFEPNQQEQAYGNYGYGQPGNQYGMSSQQTQAPVQQQYYYVAPAHHAGYDLNHQPIDQYGNPFMLPQAPQQTPRKKTGQRENDLRNEARKKQKIEPKTEQPTSQRKVFATYIPGEELAKTLREQGKTEVEICETIAKSAGLTMDEVYGRGLNPYTLEPDKHSLEAGW